jgi:RES domain-containing protein
VPVAWRIVKKKHQSDALTGEGARLFGGRWNTPGQAILYAAGTLSGALLEILVHSNRRMLSYYVVYRLEFPKRVVSQIVETELPEHWRSVPAPPELGRIGDQWCIEQRSAVLRVPNAIVPLEPNYLINSVHKDYRLIEIDGPMSYVVDEQLT